MSNVLMGQLEGVSKWVHPQLICHTCLKTHFHPPKDRDAVRSVEFCIDNHTTSTMNPPPFFILPAADENKNLIAT